MDDNSFIIAEVDNAQHIDCLSISDSKSCLNVLGPNVNGKHTLSIVTQNIRSINANIDIFLAFISSLGLTVDVLVLTECRTSCLNPPPSINNYNMFWTRNKLNQNDGVVAYVREELEASAYEPSCSEGNCLVVTLSPDYAVVCSYRPPCFQNVSRYLGSVDTVLSNISSRNVIFTGDINLNILSDNLAECGPDYLNLMAMHGLSQGINLPTRVVTCLDHFMVKLHGTWKTLVFEQQLTDHSPILLHVDNARIMKNSITYKRTTVNYEGIKKSLADESWEDILLIDDANVATELFTSKIISIVNQHTLIRTISKRNQPLKPWITRGVVKSIRKRDRLHIKLKQAPEDEGIREKYNKYRNVCNKIIKNLKRDYYRNEFTKHRGKIKETWKTVKEVCNFDQSKKSSAIDLIHTSNNPTQSLNEVNSYFTTVGANLAGMTLQKMKSTESELAVLAKIPNSPVNSMSLLPTDPSEIKSVVFGLKSNSAPGWDKITSTLLKQFIMFFAKPIAFLCNLSFSTGIFPDSFKTAVVCPIFKTGDKKNPSNYRPISLLSTLSKVLEKLVKRRVMRYLEKNNLLSSNQYGFRQGKSTEDAVLMLTSQITCYLDGGDKCLGVFLDLQKAFDTVSIPILLTRLENVGIRGLALDWFTNYLAGRTQRVRVEGHESDVAVCTYGVPQGSTLGPVLFLIYINDLCNTTLHGLDLLMFADDTVLLLHEKTWQKVVELAEDCLSVVMKWLENSLLTLNTSKTKYMCYSITAAGEPENYINLRIHTYPCNRGSRPAQCSCSVLSRVNYIKYLGVLLDDKLNWSNHIASLAPRIRKLIYVFRTLRTVADFKLVLQIYKALGECIIRYCICAWGTAAKTHFINAERAQRAVLKVLLYLPYRHPTTAVYEKANVLSVRKLFVYESLRRYHKKVVPHLPELNRRIDRCPVPKVKTRFAQKQFNVVVPHLYTALNKVHRVKRKSNSEIKIIILTWLSDFDYEGIESMLTDFYY